MQNPYREGSHSFNLFSYMLSKESFTRIEVTEYAVRTLSMGLQSAYSLVTTLLSPRKESKRGDYRGNMSAAGHFYFVEKKNEIINGRKKQMYRIHWREQPLEPRARTQLKICKFPVYWKEQFICNCSTEEDEIRLKKVIGNLAQRIKKAEGQKEVVT